MHKFQYRSSFRRQRTSLLRQTWLIKPDNWTNKNPTPVCVRQHQPIVPEPYYDDHRTPSRVSPVRGTRMKRRHIWILNNNKIDGKNSVHRLQITSSETCFPAEIYGALPQKAEKLDKYLLITWLLRMLWWHQMYWDVGTGDVGTFVKQTR